MSRKEFITSINQSIEKETDKYITGFISHLSEKLKVSKKDITACYDSFNFKEKKVIDKVNIDNTKPVSIVMDYSDKCHAIFGDTRKIKDNILKPCKCKFNKNLKFGAGWIISKSTFKELEEKLISGGIEYTTQSRKEAEEEEVEEDEDSTDECVNTVNTGCVNMGDVFDESDEPRILNVIQSEVNASEPIVKEEPMNASEPIVKEERVNVNDPAIESKPKEVVKISMSKMKDGTLYEKKTGFILEKDGKKYTIIGMKTGELTKDLEDLAKQRKWIIKM